MSRLTGKVATVTGGDVVGVPGDIATLVDLGALFHPVHSEKRASRRFQTQAHYTTVLRVVVMQAPGCWRNLQLN